MSHDEFIELMNDCRTEQGLPVMTEDEETADSMSTCSTKKQKNDIDRQKDKCRMPMYRKGWEHIQTVR